MNEQLLALGEPPRASRPVGAMFTLIATGLPHFLIALSILSVMDLPWRAVRMSALEDLLPWLLVTYLASATSVIAVSFPLGAGYWRAGLAGALLSGALGGCVLSFSMLAWSQFPPGFWSASVDYWIALSCVFSPALTVLPAIVISLATFARCRQADIAWKERCDQESLLLQPDQGSIGPRT